MKDLLKDLCISDKMKSYPSNTFLYSRNIDFRKRMNLLSPFRCDRRRKSESHVSTTPVLFSGTVIFDTSQCALTEHAALSFVKLGPIHFADQKVYW